MPFKSKAQRRKFAELLVKGEITPEAYERWNQETGSATLPERVRPKTQKKAKKNAERKTTKQKAAKKRPTKKKTTKKKVKRKATGKRKADSRHRE
jgi:hypothetical protein